jgi:hypothetical protein
VVCRCICVVCVPVCMCGVFEFMCLYECGGGCVWCICLYVRLVCVLVRMCVCMCGVIVYICLCVCSV